MILQSEIQPIKNVITMNVLTPNSALPPIASRIDPIAIHDLRRFPQGVGSSQIAKWDQIGSSINDFQQLMDDYDGAGSLAPTSDSIQSAREWSNTLRDQGIAAPVAVVCGVNGTITFEWDDGKRSILLDVVSSIRAEGFSCLRSESKADRFELNRLL